MSKNHFDNYRWSDSEKKSEWSKVHLVFGGIVFLVFFLCLWQGSQNKNDPGGEKQLALYSYKDTSQLAKKIQELESTMPVKAEPEQFYTWLAQVRIAKFAVEDFSRYGITPVQVAAGFADRLEQIDRKGCDLSEIRRFQMGVTTKYQEQIYAPAIDASRVPVDRKPIWQSLVLAYLLSLPIMLLMMCYKAKKKGYNLIGEALSIFRLPLAVPTWIFTAWRYPFGQPVQSLQKTMQFAGYILAMLLSVGAAGGVKAFGQSGAKQTGKKKANAEWIIQADARWGEVINGTGPEPQRQLRVTVTSPNGWVSEDIVGSNDRSWNAYITGGKRLLKTAHTTLIGVTGFRVTHDKIRGSTDASVIGGMQVFNAFTFPKKLPGFNAININTPVINFERTVRGSPGNKHLNFTVVNQTFLRSKKGNLFLGWETVLSKTATKPFGWNVGPLLEWKFPRKQWPRFGIGYLRNQAGVGVLRFRLTETLSF